MGTRAGITLAVSLLAACPARADVAPGVLEWSVRVQPEGTPVIAQLTDDDGDGLVTGCDVPDIVLRYTDYSGWPPRFGLVAVSGDGGRELWRLDGDDEPCADQTVSSATLTAGDVDRDGRVEIVVESYEGAVCALRDDGSVLWRQVDTDGGGYTPRGQLRDLTGDGTVEIVLGDLLLAGADGRVIWEQPEGCGGDMLVGDVDLDGSEEVLSGGRESWRADGSIYPCTFNCAGTDVGLLQLDDDLEAEVVVRTYAEVWARNHDATTVWHSPPGVIGNSGQTCAGDLDGDPGPEVVATNDGNILALDDDGSVMWTSLLATRDGRDDSGCAIFDFDADGRGEIVTGHASGIDILDGLTGDVAWHSDIAGQNGGATPLVADVDRDGAAEIVFATRSMILGSPYGRLHVFGSPDWAPARGTWNQEAYSVTHVDDHCGVVVRPVPSWLVNNSLRQQEPGCSCGGPQPSITVTRDCMTGETCLDAGIASGTAPFDVSWTFDDGSPAASGPSACRALPAGGPRVVRLSVRDAAGCPARTAALVEPVAPLVLEASVAPDCWLARACGAASASGGIPPHAILWDFGDGSPVGGETACRSLAPGRHVVIASVTDGGGCTVTVPHEIDVIDPSSLPEVSGEGEEPLRVNRDGARLRVSFAQPPGLPASVVVGAFPASGFDAYTHQAAACRVEEGFAALAMPPGNAYVLVGSATRCDDAGAQGSLGHDSRGAERPSTSALGLPTCE